MVQKQIFSAILLLCLLAIGCNSLPTIPQGLTDPGKEQREKKQEIAEAVERRRSEAMIKAARARLQDQGPFHLSPCDYNLARKCRATTQLSDNPGTHWSPE
jgi:hypothetical protein